MEQIKIDIVPVGVAPVAHASQFDNGRQIRFNLFNQGTPYTLTGAEAVTMVVNGEEENITNTSDNYVIWDVAEEDCAEVGVIGCELRIVLGSMLIGSKNFFLEVEMDPYNGKNIRVVTVGPADICTFETTLPEPYQSVTVDVVATQSGSGAPYPPGGGKNKFDKTAVTNGYLINGSGNQVSYAGWSISDFIPVSEGASFYLYGLTTHPNSNQDNFILFDDNKTKIGYANVLTSQYPWTIPTGTKYVKFSLNDSDLNTAMFATSEGEYEPYSNVRPINGYSSANITRCGVNLWDEEWEEGSINATTGADEPSVTAWRSIGYIAIKPNTTYYVAFQTATAKAARPRFYDVNKNYIGSTTKSGAVTTGSTFVPPDGACYMRISPLNENIPNHDIGINYPSSDTTYHAYNGQTYTIAFGQTVYGGVLDVTRGKMKPCIEYPSYNGETLSGRWLSSEATYIEGTTPPIGSQVVSLDDYGSDIDLTPVQIRALVGVNNVFADCGETTVKYLEAEA